MTGTLTLSRLVRPDIAKELVFSARIFSGIEAYEIGVATRLSNDPLHDALSLAAEIAQRSPRRFAEPNNCSTGWPMQVLPSSSPRSAE